MPALDQLRPRAVRNGLVYRDGAFTTGALAIQNGLIADPAACGLSSPDSAQVLDASGCYVIPGLIDLHFHGCMGADFSDGDASALHAIASYEASRGVTAICPASMTLPHDTLKRAFSVAAEFSPTAEESALVGINMEGPYISPGKVGAQNPAYVRPASATEFKELQEAARGLIKLVDVAPEEPGNLAFIGQVADSVRVSLAHMCASYDCASLAFGAGARHITHLFNAMPGLHHREPGPIAAAAERSDVTCEIIADGVHVHPSMVRLAFCLFGEHRMILISDSLRACGLGEGTFELGGQMFTVQGPRATIANGSLAGSVSDLAECLRTSVQAMGIPLASAVRAATENPARAIGVFETRGSLDPGKIADIVLLDADLRVRHVILRGQLIL